MEECDGAYPVLKWPPMTITSESSKIGQQSKTAEKKQLPHTSVTVRISAHSDAESIIAIDEVAAFDRSRVNFIYRHISSRNCYVAVLDSQVVGYGVLEYTFFKNGFISMVYVRPESRRRGVASALVRYMEEMCKTEKIFASTNQANLPVQSLLKKITYQASGTIDNLDKNNRKLIYFKQITGETTGQIQNTTNAEGPQ